MTEANNMRKLMEALEERAPDAAPYTGSKTDPNITYDSETKGGQINKVIARLQSDPSGRYTKLGRNLLRMERINERIKTLKEECKHDTRELIADLFNADDACRTREVETVSFLFKMTADPKVTETYKYAKILEELEKSFTPELIQKKAELMAQFKTETQKAPSIRVARDKAEEGVVEGMVGDGWKAVKQACRKLYNSMLAWGVDYDARLDMLKAQVAMGESLIDEDNIADADRNRGHADIKWGAMFGKGFDKLTKKAEKKSADQADQRQKNKDYRNALKGESINELAAPTDGAESYYVKGVYTQDNPVAKVGTSGAFWVMADSSEEAMAKAEAFIQTDPTRNAKFFEITDIQFRAKESVDEDNNEFAGQDIYALATSVAAEMEHTSTRDPRWEELARKMDRINSVIAKSNGVSSPRSHFPESQIDEDANPLREALGDIVHYRGYEIGYDMDAASWGAEPYWYHPEGWEPGDADGETGRPDSTGHFTAKSVEDAKEEIDAELDGDSGLDPSKGEWKDNGDSVEWVEEDGDYYDQDDLQSYNDAEADDYRNEGGEEDDVQTYTAEMAVYMVLEMMGRGNADGSNIRPTDAEQVYALISELKQYGDDYTISPVHNDTAYEFDIADQDNVNSNFGAMATAWIDENGNFYYEA